VKQVEDRQAMTESIVDRLTAMYARRHGSAAGRLARHGVSMTHFQTLLQLTDGRARTITELAHALDASLPSMSGICDRIEARGLIERVRSEHDRRVVEVRLTAAGRDWLCGMEVMGRTKLGRVLAHLETPALARLEAGLEDLMGAFAMAQECGELDLADERAALDQMFIQAFTDDPQPSHMREEPAS
jgi:DNA-binding MarR family transcriptional regulator